jgi:tripartite-type tricarboxylate transporter receptor subunit TctC
MFAMTPRFRNSFLLGSVIPALAAILLILCGSVAWSQTRTIRIIVPYAPGGVTDVLARLLAEEIGRARGPTMLIENRAGASGRSGPKPRRAPRPTATRF